MELRVQYNAEKLLIILCLVEFLWVELLLAEEYKLKIRLVLHVRYCMVLLREIIK